MSTEPSTPADHPADEPSPPRVGGDRAILLALTAGGLGWLKPAPGTIGSLPPVVIAAAMALLGASHLAIDLTMVVLIVAFSWACLAWTARAERMLGRDDPGEIVADEVAGQAVALLLVPWKLGTEHLGHTLLLAGIAFVAFRFFDVTKLGPIDRVQRMHGGRGVLFDDILAGVAAAGVVQVVARLVL